MVYHWHSRGRQLSIHCNGVGAIETIITAVERAQARCPRKDARHLLIHCQMATDEHVRRMKEAGILPSFYGLQMCIRDRIMLFFSAVLYMKVIGPQYEKNRLR